MANVFVYGTLIFPEVVFGLTNKNFKSRSAILTGYQRFKIFDNEISRSYPAITKKPNKKVEGKILFDVDEESLKILDFFEDSDYIRKELTVSFENQKTTAFVYVWNPKFEDQLKLDWSSEEFKEKHLRYYVSEVIPRVLEEYR